jgi:site-specific recombinase XerD
VATDEIDGCRQFANPSLACHSKSRAASVAVRAFPAIVTTRLFEKGLNIMEVASITGHKDLRMLRRYTHLKAEYLALKLG